MFRRSGHFFSTFVDAVAGNAKWPHDYWQACLLSGTLAASEKSAVTGRIEHVSVDLQPAVLPDQYPKTVEY
jgi:hypothetical protein